MGACEHLVISVLAAAAEELGGREQPNSFLRTSVRYQRVRQIHLDVEIDRVEAHTVPEILDALVELLVVELDIAERLKAAVIVRAHCKDHSLDPLGGVEQ